MAQGISTGLRIIAVFLLTQSPLVHGRSHNWPGWSLAAEAKSGARKDRREASATSEVHYGTAGLPQPVADMREAILAAVRSGRIEDLQHAWELNELKPDVGEPLTGDPVAHWKRISGDGNGREILAALGEILDAGYAVLPLGRDLENNRLYVWPYFAEVPLAKLTPPQEVELLRLVTPVMLEAMRKVGKYTHWRVVIGADGTWHSFRKGP